MNLSGSNRTWVVLAVLAVLVAGAYYLLEVRGIADESSEVEFVWELRASQIAGVRVVENATAREMAVERNTDGSWWMTEPSEEEADGFQCASLTYSLSALQVRYTIEEPPEGELGAYGLITPTYTVEVWLGEGAPLALEVGAHYSGGSYYVRRAGERAVLLVPDYALEEVTRVVDQPPFAQPPAPTSVIPVVGPAQTPRP